GPGPLQLLELGIERGFLCFRAGGDLLGFVRRYRRRVVARYQERKYDALIHLHRSTLVDASSVIEHQFDTESIVLFFSYSTPFNPPAAPRAALGHPRHHASVAPRSSRWPTHPATPPPPACRCARGLRALAIDAIARPSTRGFAIDRATPALASALR